MRALWLVMLAAGCRQALGIPSGGSLEGVGDFFIRVEVKGATGATGGAQVLLTHSRSTDTTVETLSDDTTVLVTKLDDGEDFEIAPMSGNCTIAGGRGTVDGADVGGIQITCDGLAALREFGFSAPITFTPAFDGSADEPNPQASIIVQQTSWAPAAWHAEANIARKSYNGQLADGGPFPIVPGTAWGVELANAGFDRTYTADPVPSPPLAYGYGKPSAVTAGEHFGGALAAAGTTLAVGSDGVVVVFERAGTEWTEVQRITGAPGFGASVALSADRLVVATPGVEVAVFARANGMWQPLRTLAPPAAGTGTFGAAVVIESIDTVIAGDPGCGCIARYVATQAPQVIARGKPGDEFGASLAVSGGTLVVGAPGDDSAIPGDPDDTQFADAGAAYAFQLPDFSQHEYLKSDAPGVNDRFGAAVAVEVASGIALIVIGAPLEDSAGADPDDNSKPASGAAYVYRRVQSRWTLASRIKAPHPDIGDNFGRTVAIRANQIGTAAATCVIAVGAPFEDSGTGGDDTDESKPDSGAIYAFSVAGDGALSNASYGKAANIGAFDALGSSLALTNETLVAGAPFEDSSKPGWNTKGDESAHDSGAVYAFR